MEVKYKSPCFAAMSEPVLQTTARILLLKVHVISGWTLPADELQTILRDQFAKKLVESYGNVNADEMEYAFRNNHVKDWGKAMNLNLIDEVMAPYLEKRLELSRLEESKSVKQIALPAPVITDQEFIESVRTVYGIHKDFRQIPVLTYKSLGLSKSLTAEQKAKIKETVNGMTSEPTENLYKQWACKLYFDETLNIL